MSTSSSSSSAAPLVEYQGRQYQAVREGCAVLLNPPSPSDTQTVFYNPIQQFNRDLSVLAIRAYGEHVLAARRGSAKSKKRKKPHDEEDAAVSTSPAAVSPAAVSPAAVSSAAASPAAASFSILDALSATGLRALRYASEIPFVTHVVANDLSASAIQSMKVNIDYNGMAHRIHPNIGDARLYMYGRLSPASAPAAAASSSSSSSVSASASGKFDVVDLDPYGTAAPFMDAAVQAVRDGGLLCVTCTDAGVWASNGYPEKSFALYGGVPSKGAHGHEAGLRLILHGLATSAAKYALAVEPLLSLSIDFYARVFVRVHRSPAAVKFVSGKTMMVYNCDSGCGAWSTQPITQTKTKLDKAGNPFYHYSFAQGPAANVHCEHCGFRTHLGGPMWAGPLHNPHFIQKILDMLPGADRDIYQTVDRIEGMLTTALEEDLSLAEPPLPLAQETSSSSPAAETTTPALAHSPLPPSQQNQAKTAQGQPPLNTPAAVIPRMDPAATDAYPFCFNLSALARVLHTATVPMDAFRGALRHLGYRSTRSHTKPNTLRTDAPWPVIWEVMREWVRQRSPIRADALKPGSPGAAIMAKARSQGNSVPQFAVPADSADVDDISGSSNSSGNSSSNDSGEWLLSLLKKDIRSALDSETPSVQDLVTKIEAALYRAGSRCATTTKPTTTTMAAASALPQGSYSNSKAGSSHAAPNSAKKGLPDLSSLDVVFDEALGREASAAQTKKRLVRYQMNPRANWGPISRAVGDLGTKKT